MDQVRQIRVLVPPLFFVLALLFAGLLDGAPDRGVAVQRVVALVKTPWASEDSTSQDLGGVLSLVAAGGAVVIASGVALGAISNFVLRLSCGILATFLLFGRRVRTLCHRCGCPTRLIAWLPCNRWCTRWETFLPEPFFERIRPQIRPDVSRTRGRYFYAAVTFDHENLRDGCEGIHIRNARPASGSTVPGSHYRCRAVVPCRAFRTRLHVPPSSTAYLPCSRLLKCLLSVQ